MYTIIVPSQISANCTHAFSGVHTCIKNASTKWIEMFLKVRGRTCDDAASHGLAKLDVLDRPKVPVIRHPLEAAFHFSLGRTPRISLVFLT
jgi:hypothetical protein